jgi:5-hydroxyisourate hydrolase
MAGGVSVHAVDVARGRPAQGMRVEVFALDGARRLIAEGTLGANGALDHAMAQGEGISAGAYEVIFHVGDFLRATGTLAATPPFLDLVPFRFTISDAAQHYHLPFKFTPWGFSLFRGS